MRWDEVTDVVVVGYGGAGGMAAIAAHDHGAQVVLLEKANRPGGTTRTSGGRMRIIRDVDKAVDYMDALCDGTTPRDVIEVYLREGARIPEIIAELGGEVEISVDAPSSYPKHHDPQLPGMDAFDTRRWKVKPPADDSAGGDDLDASGGANLFAVLSRNVRERGIGVRLGTPAVRLIQNDAREVVGVEARRDGQPWRIRARRGVILTCGGFAANPDMLRDYVGQGHFRYYCSPTNEGDGIRLAMGVGADLWHMSAIVAGFAYVVPDFPYPIYSSMKAGGYVYVDRNGRRFMNESGIDSHLMWTQVGEWDVVTNSYPRVPAYQVFDQATFDAGPIGVTARGRIREHYKWSEDNRPELDRGWITQASTLEELAETLGVPAVELRATVDAYNAACDAGADQAFGRSPESLTPVRQAPFYAITIWPTLLNTQGGARRNARAQILHVDGTPIPRLFSAGEFGSLWHRLYMGAGNVKECIVFGRIAGANAAALEPLPD